MAMSKILIDSREQDWVLCDFTSSERFSCKMKTRKKQWKLNIIACAQLSLRYRKKKQTNKQICSNELSKLENWRWREKKEERVGLTGIVRHVDFSSHGKLRIRTNPIHRLKTKADANGRLRFTVEKPVPFLLCLLPLPQWDIHISWRQANGKNTSCFLFPCAAIHFQRWYVNCTKGQPWQTEQLLFASQCRIRINTKKWNLPLCKRTNDKIMPANTIQILINLNMRVNGREENISCGDKLTEKLAAHKMSIKIENHSFPYYPFFLKLTLQDLPDFSPCFQITF